MESLRNQLNMEDELDPPKICISYTTLSIQEHNIIFSSKFIIINNPLKMYKRLG